MLTWAKACKGGHFPTVICVKMAGWTGVKGRFHQGVFDYTQDPDRTMDCHSR